MKKAAHFICKPEGAGLEGVKHRGSWTYTSQAWNISEELAQQLVGGFLYLHHTKSSPARMGGRVISFDLAEFPELPRSIRCVFTFQSLSECRNVAWRGKNHGRAYKSGLVDADLPHESS